MSLALKVPCNFEVEIKANSERQAFKKALEKWDSRINASDITEPDWDNLGLNIDVSKRLNDLGNGIYIQDISK